MQLWKERGMRKAWIKDMTTEDAKDHDEGREGGMKEAV